MLKSLTETCLKKIANNRQLFNKAMEPDKLPTKLKQSLFLEKYQFTNGIWTEKYPEDYRDNLCKYSDWGNYNK